MHKASSLHVDKHRNDDFFHRAARLEYLTAMTLSSDLTISHTSIGQSF